MIKKITLKEDHELGERIRFTEVEVQRINLLFGGNGAGKSTLIKDLSSGTAVSRYCPDRQFEVDYEGEPTILCYSNTTNNWTKVKEIKDPFDAVRMLECSGYSEGQAMIQSTSDFLAVLTDADPNKEYCVFIDEIDSGLDSVNLRKLTKKIRKIIDEHPKMQLFISFNNFELTKLNPTWLNMYTGKYEPCPLRYEDYVNTLMVHKRQYKREEDNKIFK